MDADNIITETPDLSYDTTIRNTGGLMWSTIIRYFIIILILIFLGFNIFTYLGKITEWILDLIRPILAFFGYGLAKTTKQVVNVSATGTKGLVDITAGTVTGGIDILANSLSHKKKRGKSDMKALDNSVSNQQSEPMPDDAGSKTQASKARGKPAIVILAKTEVSAVVFKSAKRICVCRVIFFRPTISALTRV